jgi:hypothetical protein
MASLRGGQKIWDGVNVSPGDTSEIALVGPGPYCVIYVDNSQGGDDATFGVQVSAGETVNAGRNAIDDQDSDGGVTWFDYVGAAAIAVAAGDTKAFDLSPFGPPLVRLIRTDTNGDITLTAFLSSFGPN